MTPFEAPTSVFTTFAPSTFTFPSFTEILAEEPSTVFASVSLTTSAARTFPATTGRKSSRRFTKT